MIEIPELSREYFCELDPYQRSTGGIMSGHILLDLSERTVDANTFSPNQGTSSVIWNGEVQTVNVPSCADGEDVTRLLRSAEAQVLIQRVFDGSDVEFERYNSMGKLSDDAQSALHELEHYMLYVDIVSCWFAGDWLALSSDEQLGIFEDITDEQLTAIAGELAINAKSDDVVIFGSIVDELHNRRDQLHGDD